ncbi:MAG: enolase C-terminal domain-like protein [Casimicrobiaceae bacterium]
MNAMIDAIDVHLLAVPLTTPYRLAFGPVDHYDTILVEVAAADGRRGFGEATLLTGYTDETLADSWPLARELARTLVGLDFDAYAQRTDTLASSAPFVATAFRSALDMLRGHPLLAVDAPLRVPILGLLQGDDEAELDDAFARLLADGYRTVKVKVGFDVGDDLARIALTQRVVAGRAALRVDANQGYDEAEAGAFIAGVDPAGIELFEQPCAAGDWEAHRAAVAAAARTGLPLMLDESIYGIADIERAARESACSHLKVKPMKFASLDALVTAISRIRALGMRPVLGNGVACDVSCWMEACVAARHIDNAGEMNGFRKAARMLLDPPLRFDAGHIVLEPGVRPVLDARAVAGYAVDTAAHRRRLHAGAGASRT